MKQWQAVSIGQLQHQLVTGSKLFCYQSWVSHVGYFHEGTASASARRLSITAIGVMARSTLTSLYSLLPPKGEKDPPHRPTTRQQQGRRGGNKLSLHHMTGQSWVSHVGPSFFVLACNLPGAVTRPHSGERNISIVDPGTRPGIGYPASVTGRTCNACHARGESAIDTQTSLPAELDVATGQTQNKLGKSCSDTGQRRTQSKGLWQKCSDAFRVFFSVQRLHGFRQLVTHVQPQQKDEL